MATINPSQQWDTYAEVNPITLQNAKGLSLKKEKKTSLWRCTENVHALTAYSIT